MSELNQMFMDKFEVEEAMDRLSNTRKATLQSQLDQINEAIEYQQLIDNKPFKRKTRDKRKN